MTTVGDLRRAIEYLDDEVEVRLMSQNSWPFEYSVYGTWTPPADPDACGECGLTATAHGTEFVGHAFERYAFVPKGDPGPGVLYLVEGTQLGYGTSTAWEEATR
jgi:hypothetical protein